MTPELIIPNVLVRPCMNGARQPKNASAQRDINTLAPVPDIPAARPDIPAARAKAVTTNIKSVNVPQAIPGMRRPELVFAVVPTNIPAQVVISPAGRVRLAAENIPPANVRPVSLGTHPAECAFVMVQIGAH